MKTLKQSLQMISSRQIRNARQIVGQSSILVFFFTLLCNTMHAQTTRTWDGGGADNNWSTSGNWSSDSIPNGTGEAALFTNDPIGQTKLTPNLSANVTIGQLQYSATAPSYNITGTGGSILYLSPVARFDSVGIIISNGAANQTISAAEVYFLTNQIWDIGGTTILTVSGTIEDTPSPDYALTKNGTGTLVFPGDVRYDGPTTVNAGKLVLSYSNTSMLSAYIVNGGILRATTNANALGNSTSRNNITMAGGVLELANNTGLTFGSTSRITTITGNATIRSDRLTTGAGVTHTMGILHIGAQTLSVTAGAFVNSGTAGITFGTTTLSGNATFDIFNSGSVNAQLILGAVGQSGGARSLIKTGNGTLVLNGAGNNTGGTILSQGEITMGINNALSSGSFNFAGGTLNANNKTDNTIGALLLTANSILNLSPGGTSDTLTFLGVSGAANGILTITGWSGSAGGLGTDDKIIFSGGTTPDANFLQHIHFDLGGGNIYYGSLGTGGELYPDAPLPVEISTFTAKFKEKDKVDLYWITETEINNYGFYIERKVNYSNWESLSFIEGHGNSNSPKEYSYSDNDLFAGGSKFQYRLKQVDNDGNYKYSDVIEVEIVPDEYELSQNYPNPFNPNTTIRFSLPKETQLKINLYNTLGELIETIAEGIYVAGYYKVNFNAFNLSSDMYIYRIESNDFIQSKKMMLMK